MGFSFSPGPVSTALGAALLQAVVVEAIRLILDKGFDAPVMVSANAEGGDQHNRRLLERYGHLATTMGLFAKIWPGRRQAAESEPAGSCRPPVASL